MNNILIVDNNDSFTYNLIQLIKEAGYTDIKVFKNSEIGDENISNFNKILFSPGPGIPSENPAMFRILDKYSKSKSILGVCLGHQAIAEYFGASIYNTQNPTHGVSKEIKILYKEDYIFSGLNNQFKAGLYHSWAVDKKRFPECLRITAESEDGLIMAIAHKQFDIKGIQFHPESILTPEGKIIIENWLKE